MASTDEEDVETEEQIEEEEEVEESNEAEETTEAAGDEADDVITLSYRI